MPPDDDALPVPVSEPVLAVGNADVVRTYDRFATAYDWLIAPLERGTRERVGCRPVAARSAVRTAGFDVRIEEHHERLGVWPVELLIGTLRD